MGLRRVITGVTTLLILVTIFVFLKSPTNEDHFLQRALQETSQPKESKSSQIIVMGMHRSATSVATRMLMLMGAYGGGADDLVIESPSTEEFWEHQDVILLNQWLLNVVGNSKGPKWSGYKFSLGQIPTKKKAMFVVQAKEVVQKLNQKSTYVTKDPRFSLTFPLWKPLLSSPVCVITYRDPIPLVQSLMKYEGLSAGDWLVLWENYTRSSIQACIDIPTIFLSQNELENELGSTVQKVYHELVKMGVQDLVLPDEAQVQTIKVIAKNTDPLPSEIDEESLRQLTSSQKQMVKIFHNMFEKGEQVAPRTIYSLLPQKKVKQAYATFLRPRDEIDLVGILVLLDSLRNVDQDRDFIVLTTEEPNQNMTNLLKEFGAQIRVFEPLPQYFSQNSFCSETPSDLDFLRIWQLVDYGKVVFLRPGGLVFQKIDQIFSINDVFAAEREKSVQGFESKFFVIEPDNDTFTSMIQSLESYQEFNLSPSFFSNTKDCTIEGFLNEYYPAFKNTRIGHPEIFHHDYHSDPPPISQTLSRKCPAPWDLSQNPPDIDVGAMNGGSNEYDGNEDTTESESTIDDSESKAEDSGSTAEDSESVPTEEHNPVEVQQTRKTRDVRCALPRGCNASLYRAWWSFFWIVDSIFQQKAPSLREYWVDLRHRNQLFYGCSQSV